MIVEGIGSVKPSPHKLKLNPGSFRAAAVEAKRRDKHRQYETRSDAWGRGLLGKIVIPNVATFDSSAAPIMAGFIGEIATAEFINRRIGRRVCEVDFSLMDYGDGGIDLAPLGLGIDVKTRTKDYGNVLIKRVTESGQGVRWRCAVFVFAEWKFSLAVDLLGWGWAKDFASRPLHDARRGNHKNVEIPTRDLLPMTRLISEIRSRV